MFKGQSKKILIFLSFVGLNFSLMVPSSESIRTEKAQLERDAQKVAKDAQEAENAKKQEEKAQRDDQRRKAEEDRLKEQQAKDAEAEAKSKEDALAKKAEKQGWGSWALSWVLPSSGGYEGLESHEPGTEPAEPEHGSGHSVHLTPEDMQRQQEILNKQYDLDSDLGPVDTSKSGQSARDLSLDVLEEKKSGEEVVKPESLPEGADQSDEETPSQEEAIQTENQVLDQFAKDADKPQGWWSWFTQSISDTVSRLTQSKPAAKVGEPELTPQQKIEKNSDDLVGIIEAQELARVTKQQGGKVPSYVQQFLNKVIPDKLAAVKAKIDNIKGIKERWKNVKLFRNSETAQWLRKKLPDFLSGNKSNPHENALSLSEVISGKPDVKAIKQRVMQAIDASLAKKGYKV